MGAAEHNVTSDVEIISVDKIYDAFAGEIKADLKYRFVIDTSTLKKA